MSGVDTVRGIAYQQAHAVLTALELLDSDGPAAGIRVESANDVVDIELVDAVEHVLHAKQIKGRSEPYTWGKAELLDVLRKWIDVPDANGATFEFVTDGRLGPTGDEVANALREARAGNRRPLAGLLNETEESRACHLLSAARITVDPAPTGTLLIRAERLVLAMLATAPNLAQATEEATRAVDRLYRLMFVRGGDPDQGARLFTRAELAQALGTSAEQKERHRWPGSLRGRYLAAAAKLQRETTVPAFVQGHDEPKLRLQESSRPNRSQALSVLLEDRAPTILVGRTGTGKSTACQLLRRSSASKGHVVLVAHAETYLPGRLAAAMADALGGVLNEEFPFATGRQILSDTDITLIIDGASEVPAGVRDALAADISNIAATGHGPQIIIAGRDIAALREMLPVSVSPRAFTMAALDRARRRTLLARALRKTSKEKLGADSNLVFTLDLKIERALRDACDNPLIYRMAIDLIDEVGVDFANTSTLYREFITRLGARAGTTNLAYTTATLGIVFAHLIDEGRRYADSYEWASLLRMAVASLPAPIPPVQVEAVDVAARRTGLVVPIGYTQTVTALHDSFADYLAANAHARNLAPLPEHLEQHDEQRLQFVAELTGIDAELGAKLIRDRPFLAVRLAECDRSLINDDAPSRAEALLNVLLPGRDWRLTLCRVPDGRIVAVRAGAASGWVEFDALSSLLQRYCAVVTPSVGLLALVVRVWREELAATLHVRRGLPPETPRTLDEASASLARHAREAASAVEDLIRRVAPGAQAARLRAEIGPTGLTATVFDATSDDDAEWPVVYRHTDAVSVTTSSAKSGAERRDDQQSEAGRSSTRALMDETPLRVAADRVRSALNDLTIKSWL